VSVDLAGVQVLSLLLDDGQDDAGTAVPPPGAGHRGRPLAYAHLSLWALQAAPLMIGADMSQLDPWTIELLTNDEVLALTSDPLGHSGGRIWSDGGRLEVWARPLADETMAAGLFNRGLRPYEIAVRWEDLGLSGIQTVRDLWSHPDLGDFTGGYGVTVPRHGVKLVSVGPAPGRTSR